MNQPLSFRGVDCFFLKNQLGKLDVFFGNWPRVKYSQIFVYMCNHVYINIHMCVCVRAKYAYMHVYL